MNTVLIVLLSVVCGALISGVVFYLVFFSARKNDEALRTQYREDLRGLIDLAEQKFEIERVKNQADMDTRRQAVETSVTALREQLKSYEGLVREFEADRTQKYGSIEESLKATSKSTEKLAATTEGLRALLDNSRARGQWGERMADDILRAAGLQENIQYLKNRSQDTSASRPDFTFLLPEGHKFHMDVKFPLDNYLRMSNAASDGDRERFKSDFLRDVKGRIKEIQKRDYINPDESTLDYVLLFIPNEQVYGFIHESWPGLIDDALKQKVVLCSPFTLYAVISVVRQSFENFHFAKATQEITRLLGSFSASFDKFKDRFSELGKQLKKASDTYDDITLVSYKRLDTSLDKIAKLRSGGEDPTPPQLPPARTAKNGD